MYDNRISDADILRYAVESGIIDTATISKTIMCQKRKELLKNHPCQMREQILKITSAHTPTMIEKEVETDG